jgi:hypothetical protein
MALAFAGAAAIYALQYLPYGYYTVTRIVVFLGAGFGAYWFAQKRLTLPALVAAGAAILFNPIFPMRMRRAEWHTFDIWTGLILLGLAAYSYRLSIQRPGPST